MEQLNNPFVIYGYKGAEYFCDRKKETKTIVEALENERNVVLMSPRRIGKTGLIHHVFENIQDADSAVKCFYRTSMPHGAWSSSCSSWERR